MSRQLKLGSLPRLASVRDSRVRALSQVWGSRSLLLAVCVVSISLSRVRYEDVPSLHTSIECFNGLDGSTDSKISAPSSKSMWLSLPE